MHLIDFSKYFEQVRQEIKFNDERQAKRSSYKRKIDSILSSTARTGIHGDTYLHQINQILDNFEGYIRSESQKEFHKSFIDAVLPHIYGPEDFGKYRERILKERNVDNHQSEILVCCPRRFGKTTSVSMFIAALLYVVPDTWISCFSTGQRASTTLLDQAAKFLLTLPGSKDRILKKNSEQLFVAGTGGDDIRRFHSFPSSVAGLKGQGGKLIILEEASRLNEEVFSEVVLPLLGVSNTALIAISTPLEEQNFFSQLLTAKKPNGSSLFKVLNITLMCEKCRAEKKDECPHSAALPSWKSEARGELVKELMKGNRDMWLREQVGVVTSKDTSAFDLASVDRAFLKENRTNLEVTVIQDNTVYVAIDPSGGGVSNTAIACGFVDSVTKNFVIMSADYGQIDNDVQMELFLKNHCEKIRSSGKFADSTLVFIIERNYGGSIMASRIANIVCPYMPMRILTGDTTQARRVGCLTSDEVKQRARIDLNRLMRLNMFKLMGEEEIISHTPTITTEIHKQLKDFKFTHHLTPGGKEIVKLSGKSLSKNDDLCMAVMLLIFWSAYAISNGASAFI